MSMYLKHLTGGRILIHIPFFISILTPLPFIILQCTYYLSALYCSFSPHLQYLHKTIQIYLNSRLLLLSTLILILHFVVLSSPTLQLCKISGLGSCFNKYCDPTLSNIHFVKCTELKSSIQSRIWLYLEYSPNHQPLSEHCRRASPNIIKQLCLV